MSDGLLLTAVGNVLRRGVKEKEWRDQSRKVRSLQTLTLGGDRERVRRRFGLLAAEPTRRRRTLRDPGHIEAIAE